MSGKGKYAAIYVRTSSEHQADKASPDEQERDCRQVAGEHGLTVLRVYRDTSRYRAKGKLVDPSGTRADRPGLVAMLKDAAAGQFTVIIAWREDRLYRGMRAMLNVLEVIQEHKIEIILARENFDAKIAPLKAWVAGMELEGMRERMTMGVKARLRAGKANTGQDRFGYKRNGETIEIVEDETRWVRQIFAWYIQRVPLMEIRRRLIAAGVPQKGSATPRRKEWSTAVIQGMLKGARDYALGIKIQTRMGEAFEIPIPPILDQTTYQRFLEVRQANKTHPANNQVRDYLIGGLLYCACKRKWSAHTNFFRSEGIKRRTPYGVYRCPELHLEHVDPNCPRTIGHKKADEIAWAKVCEALDKPEILIAGAREKINQVKKQAESMLADNDRLQADLDALTLERQWVITQTRKKAISEEDMQYQLGALDLQELHLKKELAASQEIISLAELGNWEQHAREYLEDVRAGLDKINAVPLSDDERHGLFEVKRQIVQRLVERVEISKDRNLTVFVRLDVLALAKQTVPIDMVGICSRIRSCPDRRCSAAHASPSPPACRS